MKKPAFFAIIFLTCFGVLSQAEIYASDVMLGNAPAKVYFSPGGGCTRGIVKEIDGATREVLVQAYSFTSSPIRNALINAQRRGVNVEVLLDRIEQRNQRYRTAMIFSKARVSVYIDDKHSNAHNKVMIIDRETVITGSFNFTNAAESSNAENVLIVRSKALAAPYADNWFNHRQHSSKY
ncbi:MAG TPA: phospholipase D family protein [Syntrophorhabdaceae bacterium]|nr:phospholipase D family protein [Syntrophorhabdaceae bacterium]